MKPLVAHILLMICCSGLCSLSVYSLGFHTFSLPGEPCNTDGHIREPFMVDAHALRLWAIQLFLHVFV